jgi:UDP:flavonoid glycosyltransferase YjiC (YdhE family)
VDKNYDEKMNLGGKPRILIAPLDWGLGHATRCIPIIYKLLEQGHEVFIGAEGSIKKLLQQEFSEIEYLPLKGYQIRYNTTRQALFLCMLKQVPKIITAITYEKRWLKHIIEKYKIDIVISDNRFGIYNKEVHSVFITHQLLIKSPFLQAFLQRLNYYFINKYDECWVPDFSEPPYLAGLLSHPKKMPATQVKYIGWLSRFGKPEKKEWKYILILLSGPEPQRTILEKIVLDELRNFSELVLIVRGLPGSSSLLTVRENVKCLNHLPAKQLEEAILNASFVIARSGYSTIMDLLKLKKKAILIPTPGQTEQEYLAGHLFKNNLAFCTEQQGFNLSEALKAANVFNYSFYDRDTTLLQEDFLLEKYYQSKFSK